MKLYYETSLSHHGIKGQRWGVRRFQNEDGSLTAKGKQRYDDSDGNPKPKKKSKHRLALEKHYLDKGLSQSEAEQKAAKRIRTEKIVGVAAGVTLAAGAAYIVHKHLKGKADGIVKAGTELQRIESNDDGVLHDVFFAANKGVDKTKYIGWYANKEAGRKFVMKIGVDKNVKLAGENKAVSVFKRLYENDTEFRNAAENFSRTNVYGNNKVTGNDFKKMYENFNTHFGSVENRKNASVKKFFNVLKNEGYGAVRDSFDMKVGGMDAKNPLIFFGSSKDMTVKTIRELTDKEIIKADRITMARDIIGHTLSDVGGKTLATASIGTVAVATGVYADSAKKHASATKRK